MTVHSLKNDNKVVLILFDYKTLLSLKMTSDIILNQLVSLKRKRDELNVQIGQYETSYRLILRAEKQRNNSVKIPEWLFYSLALEDKGLWEREIYEQDDEAWMLCFNPACEMIYNDAKRKHVIIYNLCDNHGSIHNISYCNDCFNLNRIQFGNSASEYSTTFNEIEIDLSNALTSTRLKVKAWLDDDSQKLCECDVSDAEYKCYSKIFLTCTKCHHKIVPFESCKTCKCRNTIFMHNLEIGCSVCDN